jgi:peptidoglycan/LPS O-acetylase OafA/YrhL
MSRRLHYIDWLRVLAILLLFPFHTWRVFNAGDPFYVKSQSLSEAINAVIWFIDFWHMPLLFLLAGASTYFALTRRTGRQYLGERVTRLLVPLFFGWLVLIPPQTWYGARFNSGYTKSFLTYLTSGDFLVWNVQGGGDYYGGFGLGHLWFIMYLFFIALFALPLLWWWSKRGTRGASRFSRFLAKPYSWLAVGVLLMLAEAAPSPIDDKSFFYFMTLFILGYAAVAEEEFIDTAVRWRWPALGAGVAILITRMTFWRTFDAQPDPSVLRALFTSTVLLGVWLMIVGLLGLGRRLLDKPSRQLTYLAQGSYALYLLHQTVIVVLAFYLIRLPGPWVLQWAALLGASVLVTFALYEVINQLNPLRFLFGMKPKPREEKLAT